MGPSSNEKSKLESLTIDWLRFPMAALIVLLHTGALGLDSSQPIYRSLSIITNAGICRLAVPCFFFISGYLFFSKLEEWDWHIWTGKLKSRIKTLFIPYLLWNIIAALVIYGYRQLRAPLEGREYLSFIEHINNWGGWWDAGVSFDGPLWFIRELMLLCILAPLIFWILRHLGLYWLILCGLASLWFGQPIDGILYFSAGSYLRLYGKGLLNTFNRYRTITYILSPLLLALILLYFDQQLLYLTFRGLFIIFGIVASFNLVSCGLEHGYLHIHPFLSKSSFLIFVAHNILILHDISHSIVLRMIPIRWGELYNCIDLFLRPTIATGICLSLYWTMSKLTPRMLRLLTGGRI